MRRTRAFVLTISLLTLASTITPAAAGTVEEPDTATYLADGTAEDSTGPHEGTWTGTEGYVQGDTTAAGDLAFSLDGTSRVVMDRAVGRFGTDPATMTFAFTTTTPARMSLLSKRRFCNQPPEGWWDIRTAVNGGKRLVFDFGQPFLSLQVPVNFDDGAWHQVALQRTNTEIRLTVDGVSTAVPVMPPTSFENADTPMGISTSPCVGVDGTANFAGAIDDLVVTRHRAPRPTTDTSTYPGDGTPGDTTSTHGGTWTGTEAYAPGDSGAPGDRAFSLDGASSIRMDGEVGRFRTDIATISFAMQTTSPAKMVLVGKRRFCNQPPEGWWEIRTFTSGGRRGLLVEFGQPYGVTFVPADVADGGWHDVRVRRTPSSITVTVDGASTVLQTARPGDVDNVATAMVVSASPCTSVDGTLPYTGLIDDLVVTREVDSDGDEIGDDADNCAATPNADQVDEDDDGKGAACDTQELPRTKDDCKKGGWRNYDGSATFRNQGDCVSYVTTNGANPPSGSA